MPSYRRRAASLSAALATLLVVSGCGSDAPASDRATGRSSPVASSATPDPAASTGAAPAPPSSVPQEDRMRIQIDIGTDRFTATLADSAASRDLLALLPVTVDMTDHGSVEKTGPLPAALSLDGQPAGADPDVGDLGYYAPGEDLVLYYGDQSYYDGIVVLGSLDGDAAARIAAIEGDVTATVTALVTAAEG